MDNAPLAMNYERDNIQRLDAYAPGEQPQIADVVKMNTNENPYPPAEAVLEAIRSIQGDQLRRYPPPLAGEFRKVAGALHNLDASQVIATNGGDELLRMAITALCTPGTWASNSVEYEKASGKGGWFDKGGGLGQTQPTYSLYDVLANIHDTPVTNVALNDDWSIPDDFAAKLNDAGCRLAMVVNPHAPSGRLEPLATLEAIAQNFRGVLLIDEAYIDFAEHDALPLLDPSRELDNVLILGTLSKGYSLAGLRLGYGLGSANLIATLDKVRDSYNTDVISQAAAVAALGCSDVARANCEKVIAERDRLARALSDLGWSVSPSQSNFLLVKPGIDQPSAQTVFESLKQQAIFVRYFNQARLRDKLRITIGRKSQNDKLLAALKAIL